MELQKHNNKSINRIGISRRMYHLGWKRWAKSREYILNDKSKSLTAEDISKITDTTEVSFTAPSVGTVLKIDTATGYLAEDGDDDTMEFEVVKVYNLADQQPAVKVMRIK